MASLYDFEFWERAREIVMRARSSWNDEWLTPGEVADILGVSGRTRPVNKAIHAGSIKATRWGNWWILRSSVPAKGMAINHLGEVVPAREIGRKHCGTCRRPGHLAMSCPNNKAQIVLKAAPRRGNAHRDR